MKVIKRDGSVVDYDRSKIAIAIGKANAEVPQEDRLSQEGIDAIIDRIEGLKRPRMLVEDIQDLVEQGLVAENKFHLAKTYIIYRYNRALVRKANTTDESILSLLRNENKELAEENSNKNTMIAATQRDYIAGEVSRDLTRRILLPEYISKAHDEGASVLIVEKMPTIGGNTIKASAGMNAAETRFQRVKGIQDSKELFYQETLRGGHNKNNPQLLRRFVENAPQAIEWLADRGIMLNDITTTGGMSIDRTHRPRDGSAVGGYLISGLVRNITKRGIDVLLDTSVEEILMSGDEVSGVRLINDENEIVEVQTKSIVVATGGFSANSAMVVKYRPDLEGFVTTNHKGATGSGIALLERIGAGTVDMGEIQIHPTVEQQTSYLISESIRGGGAILVNQQGNRFFNEMETRDKVSAAIIALPEHYAYIVFDEHVRAKNKAADEYIAKGFVTSASSPRELAEKLGMDYHAFLATLECYNGAVEKQHDEQFGRTTALRAPINEGPFHAIRIAPGVHHTMGGVTINTDGEVLNVAQQPIRGAYAAGEVVGGIHGGNRIGGNAVADIIIFGTLAGRQAAKRARG